MRLLCARASAGEIIGEMGVTNNEGKPEGVEALRWEVGEELFHAPTHHDEIGKHTLEVPKKIQLRPASSPRERGPATALIRNAGSATAQCASIVLCPVARSTAERIGPSGSILRRGLSILTSIVQTGRATGGAMRREGRDDSRP